jgi:prepilin-type N-terminal cleavage/methylation domain-containing protein
MKKGFTLVELLGTIVVLGIILTIAIPSIIQTMRRANINEANAYLVRLYNASETYIELNKQSFDQLKTPGGKVDIPVKYLIDEGMIRELGQDPASGSMITEDWTVVATTQSDNTISYDLYDQNTNIDSYVQDGLVLHFDAINNFGMGHSNTTTVWNDLSNQNNDILNVNPIKWTNKSLVFANVADILRTNEMVSGVLLGKDVTMEIYLRSNELRLTQIGLDLGLMLKLRTSGTNPWWNAYPITSQSYSSQYSINQPIRFAYRNNFTSSSADKWYNTTKTSATVSDLNTTDKYFDLGTSEFLNGEIYAIRLYNRALSDAEIQANYELDQVRYR